MSPVARCPESHESAPDDALIDVLVDAKLPHAQKVSATSNLQRPAWLTLVVRIDRKPHDDPCSHARPGVGRIRQRIHKPSGKRQVEAQPACLRADRSRGDKQAQACLWGAKWSGPRRLRRTWAQALPGASSKAYGLEPKWLRQVHAK